MIRFLFRTSYVGLAVPHSERGRQSVFGVSTLLLGSTLQFSAFSFHEFCSSVFRQRFLLFGQIKAEGMRMAFSSLHPSPHSLLSDPLGSTTTALSNRYLTSQVNAFSCTGFEKKAASRELNVLALWNDMKHVRG